MFRSSSSDEGWLKAFRFNPDPILMDRSRKVRERMIGGSKTFENVQLHE